MTASAEPTTFEQMLARKRAADARQAEAAQRYQQTRREREERIERLHAELEAEKQRLRAEEMTRMAQEERKRLDALVFSVIPKRTIDAAPKSVVYRFAQKHGLTRADLIGPSRKKEIVEVRRQAIALVAQKFPEMSLKGIGRQFGKRDHTTILHMLRQVHGPDYSHRPHARIRGAK